MAHSRSTAVVILTLATVPVTLGASLRGSPAGSGPGLAVDTEPRLIDEDLPEVDMPDLVVDETFDWPGEEEGATLKNGMEMADSDETEPEDVDPEQSSSDAEKEENDGTFNAADNIEYLTRIGELADANNDTLLSADELRGFALRLRELKRKEHTRAALDSLDTDGDRRISKTELGSQVRNAGGNVDARRFVAADQDGDGLLNETELHAFAHPEVDSKVLRVEVEHQFNHFDVDQNGRVNFEEFKRDDESEVDFSEEASREDFVLHDDDHSGDLDITEFEQLMGGHVLLSDSIKKAIAAADGNGDGHIHIQDEVPQSVHNLLGSEFIEDFFFHEYARLGQHEEL